MNFHLALARRAPGDVLAASALVRDLKALDPDIRLSVAGNTSEEIYRFDPRVSPRAAEAREVPVDYRPTIDRAASDRSARYLYAAHDAFEAATGLGVPRGPAVPELVLGPDELTPPYQTPYAVVACGSKTDIPAKQVHLGHVREVVRATAGWNWKQAGVVFDFTSHIGHCQSYLGEPAENLLGRTSLRGLFRLVAHAEVVLCGLSLPALAAAALGVPCVVLAGGREDPWLYEGLGVDLLHTTGELDCCRDRGCRSAGVVGPHPGPFPPGFLCRLPVLPPDGPPVGACMERLGPDRVLDALAAAKARGRACHHKPDGGVTRPPAEPGRVLLSGQTARKD